MRSAFQAGSLRPIAQTELQERTALALWVCRPTFSNHVAVAGGQKEIDNTYGGPEHKRHSHEHDNKDRDFPPGYIFHFSARIEPIYLPHLNSKSFAAKRASFAREAAIRHRHKKKPRTMPGLELPEKLDQHLATTGQPSRKRSLFQRGRCDRAQR